MKPTTDGQSPLRFLDASCVKCPGGKLSGLPLHSQAGDRLGTLSGVLIDPGERRIRYFVVQTPGWFRSRKYLISTECVAKMDCNTLQLDICPADMPGLDEFDSRAIRSFSDEDAVEAMFTRRVA